MTEQAEPIRVAIACQGGGSHTAFTAGVLSRLLEPDVTANHKIVALSGLRAAPFARCWPGQLWSMGNRRRQLLA